MKENTGEIDSKNVVKNRELLYRMIISQLYYDGFQPIAATLSAAVHADPPCPPSDRLLNLMMVGLQHEPDRKDRLAASSGAEHLLGTTGFDVQHVKGADNLVADAFSRVESVSAQDLLKSLAQSQASDEELISLQDSTSLRLTRVPVPGTNFELVCDESTGKPRPFVTAQFRKSIFESLHNLSHPGVSATSRLIAERFVWPSMRKDCRNWTRACTECQRSKVTRHTASPLATFSQPSERFSTIHLDIIGQLPYSNGQSYCLTVIDRFSRWPEVFPMPNITAETCTATFISGWLARFGCPRVIITDRGSQFSSHLFQKIVELTGAEHRMTTSYHPQCNGMVERLHRQLKAAIMCHANPQWTEGGGVASQGVHFT
ncbi:retrovirus-related Pol polyprotein from transposon 412 isoform X3 [Bicyclus anynana]|uniref:RNA-directed DNA polymerase n=1 Tax=Bicyclus anynana TaxID=110368 RepID=A0ABM3M4J1_BICAN|nr:retrovirus-related Pol polyprotein from transposon 412 isoform X3 [Bicyclus anynana]